MARVIGLLCLAYGYLGLVLVGSLAVIGGAIAILVLFPNAAIIKIVLLLLGLGGGLFWAILKGLWVRLEPPQGFEIHRKDAPALFALLDSLQTELHCRAFHRVLMVFDYNAAVVQLPRLGVFGWYRNYLLLGLPLMQHLGPDEFKAVLAHEFAHSSGGHAGFGNWLYRVRRSWERIFEQMSRQGTGGQFVLTKFLNWFWPIFNAHAFVLARANEYEADACAVRLAGPKAAAQALLRLPVGDALLKDHFWPGITDRSKTEQAPPLGVAASMASTFKAGLPEPDARRSLQKAFKIETNNSDTHPCLKDRLRAMGQLSDTHPIFELLEPPPAPTITAAEHYLGTFAERVAEKLSLDWSEAIITQWQARHAKAKKLAEELEQIEAQLGDSANVEGLWKKASKILELHDDKKTLPVLDQILALNPKHAAANFVRGRYLLNQDDPLGLECLETAIENDPMVTRAACELMYGFYVRSGRKDMLRPLENRVDQFQESMAQADQERSSLTKNNTFLAPELSEEQLKPLQTLLAGESEIAAAAIVRKEVKHFPEHRSYAVAVRIHLPWWKFRDSESNRRLVNRLVSQVQLPGHFLLFVEEKNLKEVGKKVFATPGAWIYTRPPSV